MAPKTKKPTLPIADPETLLQAAKNAPALFHISAYYHAIRIMREKGYSWRELEKWIAQFNIRMSAVHLRRLYLQEDARLTRLSVEQMKAMGWDEDMIKEQLRKDDPTNRLIAADPEEAAIEAARKEALLEAGVPAEALKSADFSQPVTVGRKKI